MIGISVDTPQESEHLRQSQGYTFPILSDSKDEVIRQWDLVHTAVRTERIFRGLRSF